MCKPTQSFGVVGILLLLVASLAHAAPPTPRESFQYLSHVRSELNLPPLTFSEGLTDAAVEYGSRVALTRSYGHNAVTYSGKRAIFHNTMWRERELDYLTKYELLLVQFEYNVSVRSTIDSYKVSPVHWSVITDPNLTHVGIGTYEGYDVSVTIIYGVKQ